MLFIVPILAIFLLVWAVDAIYYEPTHTHIEHKDKNLTKKEIQAEDYFKKYIDKK